MIGYAPEHNPRSLKPATRRVLAMIVGLVLTGTIGIAYADYAIDWHTIDGGGEMSSTGGTY